MMMNNRLNLIGHVGQAPTFISFEDTGNKVVKFSVAVKEYSANKEDEKVMWVDVNAWNGLGDRALKLITKGREIALEGNLSLQTYTKEVNGAKVEVTKPIMKLSNFYLCGRKPAQNGDESAAPAPEAAD